MFLIFALTSSFRFLLTLYRRLFVVLALANLGDNAVPGAGSLKTLKSRIQRFVFTNADFCHLLFPPFAACGAKVFYISPQCTIMIILYSQ